MKSVSKFALLFAVLFLTGCSKDPIETTRTDNSNFEISKLFTKDGCVVYRFYGAGSPRYFAKCENANSDVSWRAGCGKACTRPESIQTSVVDK